MQEQKRTFKYGDVFHVAGLDWIVLRTTPAPTPGCSDLYFCEATEDVFQAPFDENDCNDWNKASLRKRLNGEFLDNLIAECPGLKDAIVPTYRNLTADDGLRDYGNCLDKVTMLTADEYRQTRDLHPAPEHWRWLITPDGTPKSSGTSFARCVSSDGGLYYNHAYDGYGGVRPALNLSSDILVSDAPDSEGYYTIIWNNAPTTPPSITVPEDVRSGKGLTVSWAASVDPDTDAVSYELERRYNSGAWSKIYDGAATQFSDTITTAMNTVAYRVRAKDSKAAYSAYTTSPTRTVTHNVDPTVSGSDQQLGVVTTPPSFQYTVNDGDAGDTLTIVESLDGVALKTITPAERNHQYTFALTAAQFAALTGPHTMTIKVSDSAGNSVTRTITFTRSVSIIDFDWKVDDTSAAAQKILVSMRYNAHEDGVTIQVCNNYNDEEPTWETAQLGLKHIFSNSAKTADSFAVGVRVQITKAGGYESIACYSLSASYI